MIEYAKRVKEIPPYLFSELDEIRKEVEKKGIDIINLSIGDPDLPTPKFIVEKLKEVVEDSKNHHYPPYAGLLEFRDAVAQWYKNRFQVDLISEREVIALIGSKEGIAHMSLAFLDPADYALVPDPGYPVYKTSAIFAGGIPYPMPLLEENNFLPDLSQIPEEIARRTKLMFLNYPNNPTSAVAEVGFFKEVVEFASRYSIIVCHDAAYSEIAYNGYSPISFLQIEGAKEIGIEFHSLSKTFNMTGWRIGFAVGNRLVLEGLAKLKTNIDSSLFQAIQLAGREALLKDPSPVEELKKIYQERKELMVKGLRQKGLKVFDPLATFYLWIKIPSGYTSASFSRKLLSEAGIISVPGNGFGIHGEGYVRMALTIDKGRLEEAITRISNLSICSPQREQRTPR